MTASTFPASSSSSKTSTTIVFTGTNYDISGYTATAIFGGIAADSIVVDSASQVTATFTKGVPVVSADTAPVLTFTNGALEYYSATSSNLANTISVTASTSGLTCSFAGGCTYEVTAEGLTSVLQNNGTSNYISVCDEKCDLQLTDSSSSVAKCKLPGLSTIYSNTNFNISEESDNLKATSYFGTSNDYLLAFDDKLPITPASSSSTCNLGMVFKEGHVGVLTQVKYFINEIT